MLKKDNYIKIGYFTIYKEDNFFIVDSGKTLKNNGKVYLNKNRILKKFNSLIEAKSFALLNLKKHKQIKPKTLYLVLILEEESNVIFVKVGITSKKFILRRFSKLYGYKNYKLDTILRRIDTTDAEKLETEIKDKLNKKRSVLKYRPLKKDFSGYSECYSFTSLNDILMIFDDITKNC